MAEKISVQIALEGGAEVQRQLEGISETGQKAFDDLAKSAEEVGGFKNLKTEEVQAQLKAAGVEAKELGQILKAVGTATKFETLVQGVQSVEGALVALGRAAGPVGAAIVAAFTAAVKSTLAFADAVNKVSAEAIKVGAGIAEYDKLRRGLEQAGIAGKAAADGIAHFQKQLGMPGAISFDVLTKAGTIIKGVGEDSNTAAKELPKFIEQLRQMPDSAARSQLAIQKLGSALGTQLIQALRTGSISVDQFAQKWGTLTPQMEAAANRIEQAQNRLSSAFQRLNTLSLAPTIIAGLNAATAAVEALGAALERNPWGVFLGAAQAALNPIQFLAHQAVMALGNLASSITGITWDTISSGATTAWNAVVSGAQSAGNAIVNFVSSLTGITWDAISSGATTAWNAITTAVQSAGSAISSFVSSLTGITWDAISGAGVAAWDALTGAIQGAIDKLLQFIGLKSSAPGTGGGGTAQGKARGGLIGGRGSGTSDSNLAWLSRGEHIMPAHVVRQPGMLSLLEGLRRGGGIPGFAAGGISAEGGLGFIPDFQDIGGGGLSDKIANWIVDIANANNAAMRGFLDTMDRFEQVLTGIADALSNSLFRVTKDMNETVRALSNRELARGGLLGGRGTGTSDSNLAWVSRGEYITPARAVRQPGVLAFLEALRRSGGNLRGVLDGMGRFALGGLVPRPVFAGGGSGGSMSNVTINFPGLPPIAGLRASADVVGELQKAAAMAQVRSGGRKPSRYS